MTNRNTKTGGLTNFTNESPTYQDVNDTNDSIIDATGIGVQIPYNILDASLAFENQDNYAAEDFISAVGANSTVNLTSTDCIFDTDHYRLPEIDISSGDTLHDPDSFTNATNAFDSNDTTFADKTSAGTGTPIAIGQTFAAQTITNVRTKFISITATVKLQSYNGSIWSDEVTLTPGDQDILTPINASIQGLRLEYTDDSTPRSFKVYSFEYFDGQYQSPCEILSDVNTIDINDSTNSFAVYVPGTYPTNTSISVDLSDGINTINLPVNLDTKLTGVVEKGLLTTTTDLEITLKPTTTDSSVTPLPKGWSIKRI